MVAIFWASGGLISGLHRESSKETILWLTLGCNGSNIWLIPTGQCFPENLNLVEFTWKDFEGLDCPISCLLTHIARF